MENTPCQIFLINVMIGYQIAKIVWLWFLFRKQANLSTANMIEVKKMSKTVRLSSDLYRRLGEHSEGFETPAEVIEKILDLYEIADGKSTKRLDIDDLKIPASLEIEYLPVNNEQAFKEKLLTTKQAHVEITQLLGDEEVVEVCQWNANKFTSKSNVSGNLRSGLLRNWKEKGIIKVRVSTHLGDFENVF